MLIMGNCEHASPEGDDELKDELKVEGVFSKGYGIIPKLVMKDKNLTVEAKAIYAYISSYAGNGDAAFPAVDLICSDLGMSENRFFKHRKLLVEFGYITISRKRKEVGWSNNVYTICHTVHLQNEGIRNEGIGIKGIRNEGTNNNSLNNNKTNNNKTNNNNNKEKTSSGSGQNAHAFYQSNFGIEPPFIMEDIEHWINDMNEELVIEALKKTVEAEKSYSYAKGILKNWLNKGIKTIEQVEAESVSNNRRNGNARKEPESYGGIVY